MIKLLFITFLLFAFYGSERAFGQTLQVPAVQVQPVYVAPHIAVYAPPPVIYRPQVQMIPYQYDRTEVIRRDYRTPLRDLLFGRYRVDHFYRQQQVQQ